MHKKNKYKILQNKLIAKNVYEMVLEGDTSDIKRPGQFINIELNEFYLRRPISICEYTDKTIKIIYKVVGDGTEKLSYLENGAILDCIVGLGNGYDIEKTKVRPLLIGGGVGTPPMYELCKQFIKKGIKPLVVLGFASSEDVFYEKEFLELGAEIYITTNDGTYGTCGFVTDKIKELNGYDYYYACGPKGMLKAVYDFVKTDGEISLEERMGCGFGACMGCSCKTQKGNKRICKDGPVFNKEDIIW